MKKTEPTLNDYQSLVEKLCKANQRSQFEEIYHGFFKAKEPIFPKYLIETDEDKKLVTGLVNKVNNRVSELKKSKTGADAGHFLNIIAGDLFLGL